MAAGVLENVRRPQDAGSGRINYQRLIDDHLAIPGDVQKRWRDLVQGVVRTRRAEQLHAAREEYQQIVRGWISDLEQFLDFCGRVCDSKNLPRPPLMADLERGLLDLRRFHDELFGRWKTLDDLYEILVENFQLPTERLEAHAAANPIPQSWYDEDFDGLFADDGE